MTRDERNEFIEMALSEQDVADTGSDGTTQTVVEREIAEEDFVRTSG
jgi:ABC-type sulfate transport system substrate-binding protein